MIIGRCVIWIDLEKSKKKKQLNHANGIFDEFEDEEDDQDYEDSMEKDFHSSYHVFFIYNLGFIKGIR